MTEANAEQRQAVLEMPNEFDVTDIRRVSRPWAQYAEVWRESFDPLNQVRLVVALDTSFQPKLLKILADDEDKAVIGID